MADEWIELEEWKSLLRNSRSLMAQADRMKRLGDEIAVEDLWRKIGPLNRRIRSTKLKVRGIDDKAPAHPMTGHPQGETT